MNADNDQEMLAALTDKDAIRELAATYCYRVAEKDVEGIIQLFVPNCSMHVLGRDYQGADGLRELYAAALAAEPKPFLHNHVIELQGPDAARGNCLLEIKRGTKLEPGGGGRYEDTYRREDGEWKFVTRTFHIY